MLTTIFLGLSVVDSWIRRRLVISALCSIGLALLESIAFALLYLLMSELSHATGVASGRLTWLTVMVRAIGAGGIVRLAVLVVSLMITKSCLAAALSWWQAGVQSECEARLSTKVFAGYLRQNYLNHLDEHSAIRVRNLLSGAGVVSIQLIGAAINVLTDVAVLIAILATLLSVEPIPSAILLGYIAALMAVYVLLFSPTIHRLAHRDNLNGQSAAQVATEALSGIRMVQVFNVVRPVQQVYEAKQRAMAVSRHRLIGFQRLPQYYFEVAMIVGLSVSGVALSHLDASTETIPVLALLVAAALRFLPSINRILAAFNSIRASRTYLDSLTVGLSTMSRSEQPVGSDPNPIGMDFRERLAVQHVSFRYPTGTRDAIHDVSFHLQYGQSLGIVGLSGSGKTTLVDTLLGLLTPSEGSISVDGESITPATLSAWRSNVGYVPQDAFMIDGTVLENVLFHRDLPNARECAWRAVEQAQLLDYVQSLPRGLDTQIGERGAKLSGGQRQRVAIARALLMDPKLLVLDEATSALDGLTEQALTDTLARLRGRLTMVVVAHRLSTVQQCDRIAILENGRLADIGTFDDLRARNVSFAALVDAGTVTSTQPRH